MARREPSPVLVATLIQTLIWVWAEECLGVAPNPDTLQLHGISLGRKSREPHCQVGEYVHPNGTHCCMRCHAGTYLAEDCKPGYLAPTCMRCPAGTYTATDNTIRKCHSCQRCRSELNQITLSECTERKDTVCGCPDNQYQTSAKTLFQCRNCSLCKNGTIRHKCTPKTDTVCVCHHGFFLSKSNNCKPCSSCSEEECKDCGAISGPSISPAVKDEYWRTQGIGISATFPSAFITNPITRLPTFTPIPLFTCPLPSLDNVLTPTFSPSFCTHLSSLPHIGHTLLLVGLVVVLAASLGVLVAVKLIKKYCQNGSSLIFYSCVSTQQPTKEPVSEVSKVEINEQIAAILSPRPPQLEAMWAVNAAPSSMVAHELPDCVRPAGKTQLPDNPAVLYTVADHVLPSRWKEFVRRLGLSDYEIERIELEQRRVRDAQYEMLRQWRLQMGHGATVERISYVLNQMELSGCSEAVQEALSRQP